MVAIDVNLKAKSLGVDFADYLAAEDYLDDLFWKSSGDDWYIDALKSLPHDKLVAEIRWKRLDRRFPDVFDWDGVRGETA